MAKEVKPQHRRIYVTERIRQIPKEIAVLKNVVNDLPQGLTVRDSAHFRRHKEVVFARQRIDALRQELAALRSEHVQGEASDQFIDWIEDSLGGKKPPGVEDPDGKRRS